MECISKLIIQTVRSSAKGILELARVIRNGIEEMR